VAALAEHFARRYADVNGLPQRRLSEAALLRLAANPWRGNVRELENTMHRAVLLASGDRIDADAIKMHAGFTESRTVSQGHMPAQAASGPGMAALVGRRMDDVERDFIIETLHHTLGNRTHAATILGISIRALRNKLRDYSAQGADVPPPNVNAMA
jgi:DNA-binding NtrC family response regulator